MDVMDEMSMNNNMNTMLGVNSQKSSFPIDMNFISDNESITDIFLRNSKLPNSNVNINVFKNPNSKLEFQTLNGFPLTTINEDLIGSGDSLCSSPDLTKMAYLESNAILPENQILDVPRVNFQSLDYYPSINDFTEEYYPSVNNHYNNIYSIPKYRKLSNSYNNVDFNVNMLLENDDQLMDGPGLINPELLMNNDGINYIPSLVNSPVPSQNESTQFVNSSDGMLNEDNLMSTSEDALQKPFHFNLPMNSTINMGNAIPSFQFDPNFNNNTTNVYYTPTSVQYQSSLPQLVSSPLNNTKLLTIEEEPQVGQEMIAPTVIPSNDTIQTMPTPIQLPSQNYMNNNLGNSSSPLFTKMTPPPPPKIVNMESICPMDTYCQSTSSFPQNGAAYSYAPFTVPSQTLSHEDFLDKESLKNRKIITPTRKLKTNATSNLYDEYVKANQNKLKVDVKKEIPSSTTIDTSLLVEQQNRNETLAQKSSPESVSSAETSELKSTKKTKRSLDSTEKEGHIKYYSVCTANKNEDLIKKETIENKTIKSEEKPKETKDTKVKTENVTTTTSFGATVSTEAILNSLIANPLLKTTETKKASTSKASKVVKKRKTTKKDKPQKPEFYPCTYIGCGKVFTKPYNLKSHIKIHTAERPYKCQYCKARFSRGHDLNRHTRLHTGVKPFECQKCKKRFSRSDALSRHIKVEACIITNNNTQIQSLNQNKTNKKAQTQTKNA